MANTGFFRRYILKKNQSTSSGFTYTLTTSEYSLLTGFTYVDINNVSTTYSEITEQDLSYMTNTEYGQRLVDFLSFLNIDLSDQSILITGSTGYDPVLCPLPIPTTTTTTSGTTTTTTTTTVPTTTTTTTLPLSVISGYTFGATTGDYRLWSTSDGGTNWNLVDLSGYSANTFALHSGVAIDNQNIFIVGQNGILLYTDNNGINWYEKIISSSLLYTITKTPNNYLYVGGGPNIIYISNDFGANWSGITISGETTFIDDIHFINDNIGYLACGSALYGNVYKTTDAGLNWTSISGSTTFNRSLFSVYFIDENRGFIGGDDDRFYRTTDGGTNWIKISGSTTLWNSTVDIRDILFFDDEQLGFAAGQGTFLGSVIYRTTDGGLTWENVYSSSGLGVNNIGYFDKNRWWFSNSNGGILYTDNMGDTFTLNQLVTPPPNIFYILGLITF